MKKVWVVINLLFVFYIADGQDAVEGFVYDKNSQEPIPYASLSLKGTPWGTYADSTGFYSLTFLNENDGAVSKVFYLILKLTF